MTTNGYKQFKPRLKPNDPRIQPGDLVWLRSPTVTVPVVANGLALDVVVTTYEWHVFKLVKEGERLGRRARLTRRDWRAAERFARKVAREVRKYTDDG